MRSAVRTVVLEGSPQPSFVLPLLTSLNPERSAGSPTATFTRATAATVTAYASGAVSGDSPILIQCASGEARFHGARRVSQDVWSDVLSDGTAISPATMLGLVAEGQRTQYLGVTGTPATQTTASLGTGTYTLWVVGSGSATSSAGTATITGGGAATAGTPNVFTVTGAGTVTVTVAGSLTLFQLENGAFASSYILNNGAAGSTVTRNADILAYATAGNLNAAAGTLYSESQQVSVNNSGVVLGGNASDFRVNWMNLSQIISFYDGTNNVNVNNGPWVADTQYKIATRWGGVSSLAWLNGAQGSTTRAFDGSLTSDTSMQIGSTVGVQHFYGTIRNVKIWPVALPDAKLVALTS